MRAMVLVCLFVYWGSAAGGISVNGRVELLNSAEKGPENGFNLGIVFLEREGLAKSQVVELRDREFFPEVVVLPLGAELVIENTGSLAHNIYSESPNNRFSGGRLDPGARESHVFTNTGLVELRCKVYGAMIGYALIVDGPSFSHLDENGGFGFGEIPPGRYIARAWVPGFAAAATRIDARQNPIRLIFKLQPTTGSTVEVSLAQAPPSPPQPAPQAIAKQAASDELKLAQSDPEPTRSQPKAATTEPRPPQPESQKEQIKPEPAVKISKPQPMEAQASNPGEKAPAPPATTTSESFVAAKPEASTEPNATIKGYVRLIGKSGELVTDSAFQTLVFIENLPVPISEAVRNQRYQITTQDKQFQPGVLAIPRGARVHFPNNDPILHNVFSVSGKNDFDLGLYSKGEGASKVFNHTGLVRVFCNVHHRMNAFIMILENPVFTTTDARGGFTLNGLPAGSYLVKAWHPHAGFAEKQVEVNADGSGEIVMDLNLSQPRLRPHLNKFGKPYKRNGRDY